MHFLIRPLPPSLNVMLNAHWARRHATKKWIYEELWAQQMQNHNLLPQPWPAPMVIDATRYHIPQGKLDGFDNFRGSLKWPIDALVKLGLIYDDTDDWLIAGDIRQEAVKTKAEQRLIITLKGATT